MRLTIVRHATAGSKRDWPGPDERRPLDEAGEARAEALGKLLAKYPVRRLLSSPTVRCIQTLGPVAEHCDLPIELCEGLGPDADTSNLVGCFTEPALDDAVLCTHGELLSPLLSTAAFQSLMRETGVRRADLLIKGVAWRLRLTPTGKLVGVKLLSTTG